MKGSKAIEFHEYDFYRFKRLFLLIGKLALLPAKVAINSRHEQNTPLFKTKKVGKPGVLGDFFGVILAKIVVFGPKTHSGHCGTIEKRQKRGYFLTFFNTFLQFFHIFLHFLHVFDQFLTPKFKTKQFDKSVNQWMG